MRLDGPVLGRPSPLQPSEEDFGDTGGTQAPAGQTVQALTKRRLEERLELYLPLLSLLDIPYKIIGPPRPSHLRFQLSSHLERP